jgi:ATP-dependent Clp protease ATP-binding subunit ClpC
VVFDLQQAKIYQAVRWGRAPLFQFSDSARMLFGFGAVTLFLLFIFASLTESIPEQFLTKLLGFTLLSLAGFICFSLLSIFFQLGLKRPALPTPIDQAFGNPEQYNLAEFLSFEVARAVEKAIQVARKQKPPRVTSSFLFHFLLQDNSKLNFVFARANLDFENTKKLLESRLFPKGGFPFSFSFWLNEEVEFAEDFEKSLQAAFQEAIKKNHARVELGDMVTALAKYDSIFQEILMEADLKVEDIENLNWWLESLEERIAKAKRFWEKGNLARHGSLAREWTAGYTITLDRFSKDWTDIVRHRGFEEIIGHKQELEAVERALVRGELNNVLLVGEPGTGRRSLVHALAQKNLLGESVEGLNYKRIVELDLVSLLSAVPSIEETERMLNQIFSEALLAGNVVLVIDEFHNYVAGGMRPGVTDISGVLSSYLPLPQFQIIAITSFAGLHKTIEQNPSLLSLFEKVEVQEPSIVETIRILEDKALILERQYQRFVTYPALREIVQNAARYIPAVPFPKKAIDLLSEIMVYVARYTKSSFVLPEHVLKIIAEKTQIPVGKVQEREKETLLNLETLIHQRIINQDEAVNEIAEALRRARSQISTRKGPMGSFLFLGPTGVGKTETAKALAEIYFGAESRMVRLDMSEFQQLEDIDRLLGAAGREGLLTTPIRETPFSLLLLDEIEKAHPNILNLFLQVLDEGWVTDGLGRKTDFSNTIIIATSNAGYQVVLEAIKQEESWSGVKQKLLDFLFEQGTFRPEFVNRFDAFVVFSPLSKENLLNIAGLILEKLKKNLAERNIELRITEELKEKIVELGYDPTFGAREMRRVVQDKVENVLARALLAEEIKKGDKIEIDAATFTLKKL